MSLLDTASLIVTPNAVKEGKLYSVIPSDGSGDLSVTRATTATRVNSAGLVELVPYNLVTYSQDFSNADWGKDTSVTITANYAIAPDGTTTAERMQKSTTSGVEGITQNFFGLPSGNYTLSFYVKSNTGSNQNAFLLYRNFQTTAITITSEWQRVSVSFNAATSVDYNGIVAANSLDILIWGAQLNEGGLKPYQKTETRLNIPRLDYSNGTCPSLLVEPQRTNIALWSSSFDNAYWTQNAIVTANTTISPSGVQDADTFNDNSNSYLDVRRSFSISANTAYTFSVYVKKTTGTLTHYAGVGFSANGGVGVGYVIFNTTTGAVNLTDVGGDITLSANSTSDGDYYRFNATLTTGQTSLLVLMYPALSQNGTTLSSNAQGTNVFWGAQLEAGSYSTSYIPTTSASVTRNADVISKTGISSLIGQTEGTIFCELDRINGAENMGIWMRTGASAYNEMIAILINPDGTSVASIRSSATNQFVASGSALSSGKHKFALAYKANDFAFYIDGVQISTSTSGTPPTCDQVYLGGYPDGGARASKNVATALWKTRLTNTQLAQLTTI
jgi:hypothetical protein